MSTAPASSGTGGIGGAAAPGGAAAVGGAGALIRLARPAQWAKGAFVFVGPLYGQKLTAPEGWLAAGLTFVAFGLASSACYVFNDLQDREADRTHPRKRHRPIASGAVSPRTAAGFMGVLLVLAVGVLGALTVWQGTKAGGLVAGACAGYVLNVLAYSARLKHAVIVDVVSLALGFVLRVLGGCAAVMVAPSPWLLNVTFFLAMFLAFGKRLGERRTMGDDASSARQVQAKYTDELLRMVVVVTAVATLLTYAGWVQDLAERERLLLVTQAVRRTLDPQFYAALFWVTMLPATYGLLRCMVLVERGVYDDPTELAVRDRPFQVAGAVFAAITVGLMWWNRG